MVPSLVAVLVLFLSLLASFGEASVGDYPSVDCKSKPQSGYPFCDTTLSPAKRATDLVNRLQTSELIAQTSSIAPAISRLGIKDYNWRSNCLHGWTSSGGHWRSDLKWTVFPAPIGLGAMFDPDILMQVGAVTSQEGRALHNEMLESFKGSSTEAAGLNCFSPNVNFLRDPRWGRFEESFSEDPYLLSVQGAAYTKGIQGFNESSKYVKAAACAKHYAVHNGPDNVRATFTAKATLHDLYDSYLEAFKSQVYAANVYQIMPAYSGFNCSKAPSGAPDAANDFLLRDVLRNQFETPNISIISDNGGVSEVYETHHFAKSPEAAAALCMNATTDLDLGHDEYYSNHLQKALDEKLVTVDTIRNSVWRSFYLRILLGDFDPIDMVPYQKIDKSSLNTDDNKKLNIMSAQKSIVLLKNVNGFLPLSKSDIKKIAVVGPNADAASTQLSNYAGIPDNVISIVDGIKTAVGSDKVAYAKGCKDTECSSDSEFGNVTDAIKDASVVVMVMGLDGHLEGEGHDRTSHKCNDDDVDVLALPGCQGKLVNTVANMSKNVIIILMNGGPLSLGSDVYRNDNIRGILEVFYPGALGGTAVANVLFGEYNPGGRMPVTTYTSSKEVPDPTDYNMTTPPGRTYRYYTGTPEVSFGYGLSYTTFSYSKFAMSSTSIKQCDSVTVSVTVTNTGKVDGEEVAQVYIMPPSMDNKPFIPKVWLAGFKRGAIASTKSWSVSFSINPYLMSLVDEDGERYIFPGEYLVVVAGSLMGNSIAGGQVKGESAGSFKVEGSDPMKVSDCHGAPKCIAC